MKSVNRFALAAGIAVAAAILTIGRANADPVTTEGHVESTGSPAGNNADAMSAVPLTAGDR